LPPTHFKGMSVPRLIQLNRAQPQRANLVGQRGSESAEEAGEELASAADAARDGADAWAMMMMIISYHHHHDGFFYYC